MTRKLEILSILVFSFFVLPAYGFGSLEDRSAFYRDLYSLKDTSQKLTDNHGNGDDSLYGTRNFRFVIDGILYRGGANNAFNSHNRRANKNPLPTEGLENLCKQGFDTAIYLYSDNFSSEPHEVRCVTSVGKPVEHVLHYLSLSPFSPKSHEEILRIIQDSVENPLAGPIYTHCWNGWHASGFLSATALIQFCRVPNDQALRYWELNTDGVDGTSFDPIKQRILDFKPYPGLTLSQKAQQTLCPNLKNELVPSK